MMCAGVDRRNLESVEARLNFHGQAEGRTYLYTYAPPPGVPALNGSRESRKVRVWNGWHAGDLSLDTYAFQVGTCPTKFTDWDDHDGVRRHYYPEVEAHVLAVTGGKRAIVFDHNVRCNAKADHRTWANTNRYARTASWAHNDYTVLSGSKRAAELLGTEPSGRYAYVNLWRPILEPLRDSPLAVCDGRTIDPADLETAALIYPERQGQYYLFRHNPGQTWFYFPEMRRDEALFLKCMDSAEDGRTRFSAHTAFEDPSAPAGSPAAREHRGPGTRVMALTIPLRGICPFDSGRVTLTRTLAAGTSEHCG
jgi:hypothetical protein